MVAGITVTRAASLIPATSPCGRAGRVPAPFAVSHPSSFRAGSGLAGELDFKDGFDSSIVEALLDRVVVHKTEDKKTIDLQVFFKVLDKDIGYRITRGKNTSVCSASYI